MTTPKDLREGMARLLYTAHMAATLKHLPAPPVAVHLSWFDLTETERDVWRDTLTSTQGVLLDAMLAALPTLTEATAPRPQQAPRPPPARGRRRQR